MPAQDAPSQAFEFLRSAIDSSTVAFGRGTLEFMLDECELLLLEVVAETI